MKNLAASVGATKMNEEGESSTQTKHGAKQGNEEEDASVDPVVEEILSVIKSWDGTVEGASLIRKSFHRLGKAKGQPLNEEMRVLRTVQSAYVKNEPKVILRVDA